jgi:hypothetical protein
MAETAVKTENHKYVTPYKKDYMSDWDVHQSYISTFDAYEAMLIGQVYDSVSNSVDGSKITDSYAATLAIERAARVMGKLPDGQTEATAKADQGKAAFMDILRQKWIYPNANSQHNFDTKLRLWQLYSSVYGYMPMFYDWNVATSGYVGPDCWLWNPRNLIPQQGRVSVRDMDYVTALTWVSKKYLEDILEDVNDSEGDEKTETGGWDIEALKMLIEVADNTSSPDAYKDTQTTRNRTPQSLKKGVCLATRYEAGEDGNWCTFAPEHGYIQVRELPNPHKNGRIPFVIKYAQPLYDSFYGLGDFQRAKPLQFARDGLTNFYFKGIKINLIPPIIANANGVMKHTLDYREGGVMLETIPNSIRRLDTSNAGLSTYQAAQSMLTGSLLSLYGSQNASIPGAESLNPSQGKTPAAIGLYSDKEATRDGQERMYLEGAIEELTDGFFSLIANIGTEDIPVNLFAEDLEAIEEAGLTDVLGLLEGKFAPNSSLTGGELRINPAALKGVEYRFNITSGSTAKTNRDAQLQQLETFMGMLGKFQNIFKDDPRIEVNWADMMQTAESLSDIKGAKKFVTIKPGPSPQELQQQKDQAALEAQNKTQATAPGGQVHESADLVKLFLGTDDESMKQQIAQTIGFEYTPKPNLMPQPTVSASGHSFHDPHLAQVADALHAQIKPAEPHVPTTNATGAYHDPTVAAVAEQISK